MKQRKHSVSALLLLAAAFAVTMSVTVQPALGQDCIPAGAVIDSATFSIYVSADVGETVRLHRITAPWDELLVTWNSFAASYDPAVEGSFVSDILGWRSADVTALVQAWVNGAYPNYGILLEQGQTNRTWYPSSETSAVENRPKLEICYTAPIIGSVCVTIQRPGSLQDGVADTTLSEARPDENNGASSVLMTGLLSGLEKHSLLWFDICSVPVPECTLEVTKTCFVPPPQMESDCQGEVISMVLEYTGLGCAATTNEQEGKVSCTGGANGANPVDITVTDKKKLNRIYADVLDVPLNGTVLVAASHAGKEELAGDTRVHIFDPATGALIEEIVFHTSCSKPLNVGDQFGSVKIVELTTTEGGLPAPPAPADVASECTVMAPGEVVEFTYTVTNIGDVAVTDITVMDDQLGEIPGSPIASLGPFESATLTTDTLVTETTTNIVTVTGYAGAAQCQATASSTVTVEEPPDAPCTTKVAAMLLRYTGPTILGATVEIFPKSLKGELAVVYSGVDLISGITVLSDPAENGWTVDGTAHGMRDLGAKTTITINGVAEVIHTSCSTPFVADAPAPLDNPTGDPSPNWFVVDFIQK